MRCRPRFNLVPCSITLIRLITICSDLFMTSFVIAPGVPSRRQCAGQSSIHRAQCQLRRSAVLDVLQVIAGAGAYPSSLQLRETGNDGQEEFPKRRFGVDCLFNRNERYAVFVGVEQSRSDSKKDGASGRTGEVTKEGNRISSFYNNGETDNPHRYSLFPLARGVSITRMRYRGAPAHSKSRNSCKSP